jgi:hypothetical protein
MAAALTALLTAFAAPSHAGDSAQGKDLEVAASLAGNELDAVCTPPSDFSACAEWHKVIRANFSPREIGILFGTATSYPEYATSYERIKSRYARLHDEFSAERHPARVASVD